jgi:DNA repair protein RadC
MTTEKVFTVRDMPREERPRERLQEFGADRLSAVELRAIVIGRGVAGRPVLMIAQELMGRFGTVEAISEATIEELGKVKGIGTAKAAQLKAAFALAKRRELKPDKRKVNIGNPQTVADTIRPAIQDRKKEHFQALLLDTRNTVIDNVSVTIGTLNASLVHPREVFKDAIKQSAASVIIAHNHPSGNPEPSEEDIKLTKRLVEAGRLLGIEVLDHIIIVDGGYFSFKERGLM